MHFSVEIITANVTQGDHFDAIVLSTFVDKKKTNCKCRYYSSRKYEPE